jgi:hypothetical protein
MTRYRTVKVKSKANSIQKNDRTTSCLCPWTQGGTVPLNKDLVYFCMYTHFTVRTLLWISPPTYLVLSHDGTLVPLAIRPVLPAASDTDGGPKP